MWKFRILSIVCLLSVFVLPAQEPTKEQIRAVKEAKKEVRQLKGSVFPEFSLTAKNGEKIGSEQIKGKYVLFNFWFTSCRPCIQEIPELNELVEAYKHRDDILFLAPTFHTSQQVEKFEKKFTFDYQLLPDQIEFCAGLNVQSYPTHILVNPDGIIEKVVIGYSSVTVKTLRKTLEKMLAAK